MRESWVFGEWAGAYAARAIGCHAKVPVFAAGFVIEMPREMTCTARDTVTRPGAFPMRDRVCRTFIGALLADFAKLRHAKTDWVIANKRQVSDDLAQAQAWTKLRSDQLAVASLFAESSINCHRNVQPQIIDGWDGVVTNTTQEFRHARNDQSHLAVGDACLGTSQWGEGIVHHVNIHRDAHDDNPAHLLRDDHLCFGLFGFIHFCENNLLVCAIAPVGM